MDPLSALGAASAIVQFIDFAGNLFYGTYKIYKAASTGNDKDRSLKTITDSLVLLNGDLRNSLAKAAPGQQLSKRDRQFDILCKECMSVAEELLLALEKLRVKTKHVLWDSFRQALRTIWHQRELASLQERLDSFRQQISLQILACLKEQIDSVRTSQSNNEPLLSSSRKAIEDLSKTLSEHIKQNTRWQVEVIRSIQTSSLSGKQTWDAMQPLLGSILDRQEQLYNRFQGKLLSRLRYREMETRYEHIVDAHAETFEWILDPESQGRNESNFVEFLTGDQKLYWVTGKPGAGKSTLIKFLCQDARTKKFLRVWALEQELFVFDFYFWCSGYEIQMSQEGFLRTLLHNALRKLPHLIPLVFPNRYETAVIADGQDAWEEPWGRTELLQALRLFVQEATKSSKIVFFIDGLDEFQGTYTEQLELVNLIYSLLGPDVKICVSSRPWNVFEDAFKSRPSLRLEDLTYPDIKRYITTKLSENRGFAALQNMDAENASLLIENVINKASGVFLWVYLVVQSLLEGLTDGERLLDLQKRLETLPADLEDLFWKILNKSSLEEPHNCFKLAKSVMTIVQLSFADESDPEFVFKLPIAPLVYEHAASRAELMRRRLNACCKGLIEAKRKNYEPLADAPIEYLHRTVKDFIERPKVWNQLVQAVKEPFDIGIRLSVSEIAYLKTRSPAFLGFAPGFTRTSTSWKSFTESIEYITGDGSNDHHMQIRLLNELDHTFVQVHSATIYHSTTTSWTYDRLGLSYITSFLHLAVKFQLNTYIRYGFKNLYSAIRSGLLSTLLEIAVVEYDTRDLVSKTSALYHQEPSPELIELLLERGANPNTTLSLSRPNGTPKSLLWYVIERHSRRPEILKLFLDYGGDPTSPMLVSRGLPEEVTKLIKAKRKEMEMERKELDGTRGYKRQKSSGADKYGSSSTQYPDYYPSKQWRPRP